MKPFVSEHRDYKEGEIVKLFKQWNYKQTFGTSSEKENTK